MKADQLDKFARYDGKCRQRPDLPCDLFLLSWTLTPTTNVRAYCDLSNRKLADEMKVEMPQPLRLRGEPSLCGLRGIGSFDGRGFGHESGVGNDRQKTGE